MKATGDSPWKWAFFGLITAASLVLTCTIAELTWRAIRRAGWAGSSPPLVEFDSDLGWRNRRGLRLRHRQPEFDVMVELDAEGHRVTPGGTSGSPILFVGDSMTFGWGVNARDTFVSRVGRNLDRPTINLGVPGYGTDQSYLALLREASLERSSLVIYLLCENDLREVTRRRMYGRAKPRFGLDGVREESESSGPLFGWVEENSYLLASTRTFLEALRYRPQSQAERANGARLVSSLVDAMRRRCERLGAKFVLVVPDHAILGAYMPAVETEVDLKPAMDEAARSGLSISFARDSHYNAAGHALVAEEILAYLRSQADFAP